MKILVVGATGALGRPVVQLLRAQGVAVRALNRHPDQAADLAALGAEVMAGDLADRASLERACAGADRVLACAHGMLGRGRRAWRACCVSPACRTTPFPSASSPAWTSSATSACA